MSALHAPVFSLGGCHACGTLQRVPVPRSADRISCVACDSPMARPFGRDLTAALACASATLLLLIPANLMMFLTTSVAGVSRQSVLASSAVAMLDDGFPELAIVVALFVVVLPLLRFGLLTAVLGSLRLGLRPTWLGRAFRHASALQTWAMVDVFMLGVLVAYFRLATTLSVEVGAGALCFAAAAILTLLTRATLDRAAVWRAIGADAGERAEGPLLECGSCDRLEPASMAGRPCPRCGATLHVRKPHALARTAALTLAAAVLYVPANLYPMATLPIGLTPMKYTVIEGVIDLGQAGLFGLALLVLAASFVIPMLKIAGLAWCLLSVARRSGRRLRAKTRLFRVVEEIGRWSMVDPFVIATFVPVTKYNALIFGAAQPAAPIFAAVVILTTAAALSFDSRLMWDAAAAPAP